MLDEIIAGKWLGANAVFGIFDAKSNNEDVEVFHEGKTSTLHFMRQQAEKRAGSFNECLADYISPNGGDFIGAFAVTAGIGIETKVQEFEADHNDYKSIMIKALADRFAEAFAEYLHLQVRKKYWAYAADESLANEDLIKENYKGIRPAPGYAACPDHTEKGTLWEILEVEKNTGMTLTESFAMYPAASVSGWYIAHPEAKYIGIGRIGKDQVESLAERKGFDLSVLEKWLSVNVNYDV
jgi:5-methyltetrahydrofolate--homocysteine methyltransferase